MYKAWFNRTVKRVGPISETTLYIHAAILGSIIFGLIYAYITYLKIPNALNKAVADTAVILIGMSMLLSGICYFWNFLDTKIIYRKHLGLMGFAFAVVHLLLSWGAFLNLLKIETWQQQKFWAPLTGLIALTIFTIMALVSNKFSALKLGGKVWRGILRTGYIALLFVFAHVVILKAMRWEAWAKGGFKSLPSTSLLVSIFILLVLLMRIALWASLKKKARRTQ